MSTTGNEHDNRMAELAERLSVMDSAVLAERVANGHFADFAIDAARAELARRGIELATPSTEVETGDDTGLAFVILDFWLDPAEASIRESLLRSEGIPAISEGWNTAHYYGYLGNVISGVRIRVATSHLQRAREILDDFNAGRISLPDEDESAAKSIQAQRILAFTRDESFVTRWEKSAPRLPGFHPWAFLFGSVWFFYRKLYKAGAIVFVISSIITWAMFSSFRENPQQPGILSIGILLLLALHFVTAGIAESLYYARARSEIMRLAAQHSDESILQSALRKQGGINFPAALAALFAGSALTFFL